MNSHVLHFATKYGGEQYHLVGIKDGKATRYDGPHDNPEGVAEARKLHDGIWPYRKPDKWLMVVTSDVPDLDPAINVSRKPNLYEEQPHDKEPNHR